jgi:hypothetical protein
MIFFLPQNLLAFCVWGGGGEGCPVFDKLGEAMGLGKGKRLADPGGDPDYTLTPCFCTEFDG